jgi:hypothetical protein
VRISSSDNGVECAPVRLFTPDDRPSLLVRSSAEQFVNVAGIVNGTLTTIDGGGLSPLFIVPPY